MLDKTPKGVQGNAFVAWQQSNDTRFNIINNALFFIAKDYQWKEDVTTVLIEDRNWVSALDMSAGYEVEKNWSSQFTRLFTIFSIHRAPLHQFSVMFAEFNLHECSILRHFLHLHKYAVIGLSVIYLKVLVARPSFTSSRTIIYAKL